MDLRGSSGGDALLLLEGKFEGKRARGRPRRTWMNDMPQWTQTGRGQGDMERGDTNLLN